MLADREDVEAGLLGVYGDTHERVDPLVLGDEHTAHGVPSDVADARNSELHGLASVVRATGIFLCGLG